MDLAGDLMATWKFSNLETWTIKIEKCTKNSDKILGNAIYDGAKIVADACKDALWTLPVDDTPYRLDMRKGIRANERIDLIDSMGIAKLQNDNDYLNVKVGFDGYNRYDTANQVIARSIESGTSFLPKFGVLRKATKNSKKACEAAMQARLDQELNNIMK